MDSILAFEMGRANRYKELMVFDWDKAASIIKEREPIEASAGLRSDWEWTGGLIYQWNNPVTDRYTYLASTWAVPELEIVDKNGEEVIECYKMKSETPGWDSGTKWPDSSLRILRG